MSAWYVLILREARKNRPFPTPIRNGGFKPCKTAAWIGVGKWTFIPNKTDQPWNQASWSSTQSQRPEFFYLGLLNSVIKPGVSERVWLLHEQIVFGCHQLFESSSHYNSPRGVKCCSRASRCVGKRVPAAGNFYTEYFFPPLPMYLSFMQNKQK